MQNPPSAQVAFSQLAIASDSEWPWFTDPTAWTVALSVIGYPLAGLLSSYLCIWDSAVSIIYRSAIILIAVSAFAINAYRYGVRGLDPALLFFLFMYTVRLVWDSGRADLTAEDVYWDLQLWFGSMLVPLLAVVLPRGGWNSRNIVMALFWVGFVGCFGAALLYQANLHVEVGENRLEFAKLNPISIDHMALTTFLVVIAGGVYWRSRALRLLSLAVLPLTIYIMFLANSRGPTVALFVCLGVLSFSRKLALLAMVIFAVSLPWFSPQIEGQSLTDYFRFGDVGREESSGLRITLANAAIAEIANHPLFGSGYFVPGLGTYPHNIILESGTALGLNGILLFLVLVARATRRSLRDIGRPQVVWVLLFFQYLIGAQFSGAILEQTALFLFLANFLMPYGPRSPA